MRILILIVLFWFAEEFSGCHPSPVVSDNPAVISSRAADLPKALDFVLGR